MQTSGNIKVNVLFYKPKKDADLADAIIYLIEHPDERIKMGLAGRKRYDKKYTFKKNIKSMIKLFDEILFDK